MSFGGLETAIAVYADVRSQVPPDIGVRTEILEGSLVRQTFGVRVTYTCDYDIPYQALAERLTYSRRG